MFRNIDKDLMINHQLESDLQVKDQQRNIELGLRMKSKRRQIPKFRENNFPIV